MYLTCSKKLRDNQLSLPHVMKYVLYAYATLWGNVRSNCYEMVHCRWVKTARTLPAERTLQEARKSIDGEVSSSSPDDWRRNNGRSALELTSCRCCNDVKQDNNAKARYTPETKSKGRSTFGRQSEPSWRQCRPRQAVEFDFVASCCRLSPKPATKSTVSASKSKVSASVDCVASVYRT